MRVARDVFNRNSLARVCEMPEVAFEAEYGMTRVDVAQPVPDDFYLFQDNGSRILAVAHLDTVGRAHERTARFVETEAGLVVYSRALDDRLGAYIILEMLPALGIDVDILLTVGEETGRSTASFFEPTKRYDWMIEFDRGGTDVVMYQYDDKKTRQLVRDCGAHPGDGIFSDISYLDHLGVKGFNWGVGYQQYHGPKAHAYLDDTLDMVECFLTFHEQNAGTHLPHSERRLFPEHYMDREDELDDDSDGLENWWNEREAGLTSPLIDDESDPFHWSDTYSTAQY